eukprot:TRINITY_DN188_c0_g1_i1.p1 TRINITY_DN188_c0_g1~~TRINITY_DN188_c0_g1_i1.p1  ORF type:complete len:422 (+),score=159.08 TRINITY_DN188_c0_g1_i1:105-1370(+)
MLSARLIVLLFVGSVSSYKMNPSTNVPPMGWMSWEIFRCDIDCSTDPTNCISENLYKAQTDAMATGGFLAAGYNSIHMDDCWMQTQRTPNGTLVADPKRFPSGMQALGDYMHARGVLFALYTAESTTTCAGYPASKGYESVDANTFAAWGVDYLKVDGCGDNDYYPTGYPKMGAALRATGREIVYSCSWPAYLGDNETQKPWGQIIGSGCNLWRNWLDIQCNSDSLFGIINHWGDYGAFMQTIAAPNGTYGGHFNDPDQLLIGNTCITDDEARTQMAIWSIIAAPLIMGNDMRNVSATSKAILFNKEAIAVNQDPLGRQGLRLGPQNTTEVWYRQLANGDVAVGLLNKDSSYVGYNKPGFVPPSGGPSANITVAFNSIGLSGSVKVRDIWAQADVGVFTGSFTAVNVPWHGTAFYRFTPKA